VAPGRSGHAEPSRPARLADVAATVAAICGAPRDGLGGEPLLGPGDGRPAPRAIASADATARLG
jgi:hypothetical protein